MGGVLGAGLFLCPDLLAVKEITGPAGGPSAQGRGLLMKEHTEQERDPEVQGIFHHVVRRITSHRGLAVHRMSLVMIIIGHQRGHVVRWRLLQMRRTWGHPKGLLVRGRNRQLWTVSPNGELLVQEKFLDNMNTIDQMRGRLDQEIFLQLMRGATCQNIGPWAQGRKNWVLSAETTRPPGVRGVLGGMLGVFPAPVPTARVDGCFGLFVTR